MSILVIRGRAFDGKTLHRDAVLKIDTVGLSFVGTNTTALATDVAFGVIYVVIGIGLSVGRRLFSYLGVIFPLIGGTGATYEVVTGQAPSAPISPLVAIAIDVVVILLCSYLLLHKDSPLASR